MFFLEFSDIQLSFFVFIPVKTPYTEDQDCPRKPGLIGNRKCLKKCRADTDCRGRNKRCMCDDVCGKSCVKPSEC